MTTPREDEPCGIGPVLTADDGTKFRVTEEDVRSALPFVAAFLIAGVAWDFGSHAEWTLGADHLYFGSGLRVLVRLAGLGIAALICFAGWRDMRASERQREEERRELAGRAFVPGAPPRWDE